MPPTGDKSLSEPMVVKFTDEYMQHLALITTLWNFS